MKVIATIVPESRKALQFIGIKGSMSIDIETFTGPKHIAIAHGKFRITTGDITLFKIEIMNRYDNDKIAFFYVDDVVMADEFPAITKAKEFAKGT